jgi:hypothetical protein
MRPLVILIAAVLAGCAGVGSKDCETAWRDLGQRDGRLNAGSQAERYGARCGKPVDAAAYEEGYRLWFSQRPHVPSL